MKCLYQAVYTYGGYLSNVLMLQRTNARIVLNIVLLACTMSLIGAICNLPYYVYIIGCFSSLCYSPPQDYLGRRKD